MIFNPPRLVEKAKRDVFYKRPAALLVVWAVALPLSFSVWSTLLNNFAIEMVNFNGVDIGWLHTVREIPGFLAIGVIFILLFMHEQVLAMISLVALGFAVAITAMLPSFQGLLLTTMIGSIGFHYFETVNQSLQLQWISKERAPQMIGILVAAGSAASLVAYVVLYVGWHWLGLDYNTLYMGAGCATLLLVLFARIYFPRFDGAVMQNKSIILRKRYWLYYVMQFLSGARRQIFTVFAAFMMVERFGFEVHQVTALFLINFLANMIFAPMMGQLIAKIGERNALLIEYAGLVAVFAAYGGVFYFGWGVAFAACLYVIDHMFFSMAFAIKTYFQKIADPKDIAPTAAVAFTINHIAAVFLPALLGYLWIYSPFWVFILAAGMAALSFMVALLIPRHPTPGNETIFSSIKWHSENV